MDTSAYSSNIFDVTGTTSENFQNDAYRKGMDYFEQKPKHIFSGFGDEVGKIPARIGVNLGGSFANAIGDEQGKRAFAELHNEYKPRITSGQGSVIAGELGKVFGTVVGGSMLGSPLLGIGALGTGQFYDGYQNSIEAGRDQNTALGEGALAGGMAVLGAYLPIRYAGFGTNLTKQLAFGTGINVAAGMATRGADAAWLDYKGYTDAAEQIKILDAHALAVDALLGVGFGVLGHYHATKTGAVPEPRDLNNIPAKTLNTGLAMNSHLHGVVDTAAGHFANNEARTAHVKAMMTAAEQVINGEPVNVGGLVQEAAFIPKTSHVTARGEIFDSIANHLDIRSASNVEVKPITVKSESLGNDTHVKIGDTYYPAKWAVVDGDMVQATMATADNQFRNRLRSASDLQVTEIANKIDFNLLNHSPVMDFGAPTLSRDGLVIGGNGRFAAISKHNNEGGISYKVPLGQSTGMFGIDPAQISGLKNPVLVKILEADVDVKKAAIASNEGAGMRMSDLENSKIDSMRLGNILDIAINENGTLGANNSLIQRWLSNYPTTELSTLVDAEGRLSQTGANRLRNAILYKAYGDSATLGRLIESEDLGAKTVASALYKQAPTVSRAKELIDSGNLYPLDISADIVAASAKFNEIRESGGTVANYLKQDGLFGAELTPVQRALVAFFGENTRSGKVISDVIDGYYAKLEAAGDPSQVSMFDSPAPTKEELLASAMETTGKRVTVEPELPFIDGIINKFVNDIDLAKLPETTGKAMRDMYMKAAESKQAFEDAGDKIATMFGGKLYRNEPDSNIKHSYSAAEKVMTELKGDVTQLKDLLRMTLVADDMMSANKMVGALTEQFTITKDASGNEVGFRNNLNENPQDALTGGYKDAKMNVILDNGLIAEIQVNIPEFMAAKEIGHKLYVERREILRGAAEHELTPEQLKQIELLDAKQQGLYADALLKLATKARNLSSDIGVPLRNTESAGNPLGSPSQAVENLPPMLTQDTGLPSTSKNLAPEGNVAGNAFMGKTPSKLDNTDYDLAMSILKQDPYIEIISDNGTMVTAKEVMEAADLEFKAVEKESIMFEVAAACGLRGN